MDYPVLVTFNVGDNSDDWIRQEIRLDPVIYWIARDAQRGAEGTLEFRPHFERAATHMKIPIGDWLVSPVMVETEHAQ